MKCLRCGIELSELMIKKRKDKTPVCSDCLMKPTYAIKYNNEVCRPWRGEVDEDLNPLDEQGNLYVPGIRICGHKDCVNRSHIILDIEAERIDVSYRTGKKFEAEDITRELLGGQARAV